MIKDVYYQRGAPDPVLENQVVLGIVRQYVPEAKEVTKIDETGGEARTYAVDSDIILKVQRPQQLRLSTSLEKEVFFLKQLEKYPNISVPKILGYGKQGTIEYTCMTRMPGIAVRYADITGRQREEMLFELGRMLFLIHSVDIKPFYESGLFPDIDKDMDEVKERLKIQFDRALQRLSENLSQSEIDKANASSAAELNKITDVYVVPCHSNPSPQHTFVDSDNKFSGVIDFGDAYISHPIFDIRRWSLHDRIPLVDGYTSSGKTDNSFTVVSDVSYKLDSIINDLSNKK